MTAAMLVETRRFAGCESVVLVQNLSDSTDFVLVEHWDSSDDHERYVKWRAEQGDLKKLFALLSERATLRRFSVMDR